VRKAISSTRVVKELIEGVEKQLFSTARSEALSVALAS
jgi:hypothetical protein